MKREILFRGARVCDGHFVNGSLVEVNGECDSNESVPHIVISYGPDTFDWFEVDPETVGQFTGMTDKNGTKIFEGDILLEKGKVNNGDTGAIDVESKRIVSIENASDGYMCVVSNYRSLVHHKTIEVIGNIHDNKELLK